MIGDPVKYERLNLLGAYEGLSTASGTAATGELSFLNPRWERIDEQKRRGRDKG